MSEDCPFCARVARHHWILENGLAVAIPDTTPLNPGHALVIPRRHEPDFLALTEHELTDIFRLAKDVRAALAASANGFNVGANVGVAAGQTVNHAHLHVIPRFRGDVEDPRGGIRWIIPARARYWTKEGR